jgi:hypothetical protein
VKQPICGSHDSPGPACQLTIKGASLRERENIIPSRHSLSSPSTPHPSHIPLDLIERCTSASSPLSLSSSQHFPWEPLACPPLMILALVSATVRLCSLPTLTLCLSKHAAAASVALAVDLSNQPPRQATLSDLVSTRFGAVHSRTHTDID